MKTIRARRGETVLTLNDSSLLVEIRGEQFGPYAVDGETKQLIWRQFDGLSIPLDFGDGALGVGGCGYAIEVERFGTSLSARWWMITPPGWEPLHRIFEALAAATPPEIRRRYDFGLGGE